MSIKYSILAFLAKGPCSASQLQNQFRQVTDEFWPLNIGQVTQTISRLERDALIEPAEQIIGANGHPTDTYRLTDQGRALLATWWTEPVIRPKAERDELVIKVALAAHFDEVDLIALLDRQRRAAIADLRALTITSRDLPDTRTAERLQVERRIHDLESEVRWLDRVEALSRPGTHPVTKEA